MKLKIEKSMFKSVSPSLIFNSISLLVILFMNKEDEKGFSGLILTISLLSFCSLFIEVAKMNLFPSSKPSKNLLLAGLLYIIFILVFVNQVNINMKGNYAFIIFVATLMASPFVTALIFVKNKKVVQTCANLVVVFSIILSIPALILFGSILAGLGWALFNKDVPFPWQV